MLDEKKLLDLIKLEMNGQLMIGSPGFMALMQGEEIPVEKPEALPQPDVRTLEPEQISEVDNMGLDTSGLDPVFAEGF